ncbi:helix-turn-helix domain-containing protein [Paenibacillus beijingensis]|nr:helix-turn-helix domain-containing protein [Paenibacillus beijingensis]
MASINRSIKRDRIPVYNFRDAGGTGHETCVELKRLEHLSEFIMNETTRWHRHDHYELFWITGGAGNASVDFQEYFIEAGTMMLISPGQVHAVNLIQPLKGFLLIFSPFYMAGLRESSFERSPVSLSGNIGQPVMTVDEERFDVMNGLLRLLEREYRSDLDHRQTALGSLLNLVMIEADRFSHSKLQDHRNDAGYMLASRFLSRVESDFRTRLRVSDYAALFHVTNNHLIDTVKRIVGRPAGELIRERRLLEAKRLLRYSGLTVDEIACQLSFDDPSYFSRFFKKNTGTSPTAFRSHP